MQLTVNNKTQPLREWALDLGVPQEHLQAAMDQGLTLQTIVDTLLPTAPQRPVTPPRTVYTPGPLLQSPNGAYTFRALCRKCAAQAREYYDQAHASHQVQAQIAETARLNAEERRRNDEMFTFIVPSPPAP